MRRKNLILLAALLMPMFASNIYADIKGVTAKIPLKVSNGNKLSRDIIQSPIESCYYGMFSAIYTSVASDLGEIEMTVTNCSTGDVWYDTFDSSSHTQHVLAISGTPGLYEVTYTTSCGDLYEGVFIIE